MKNNRYKYILTLLAIVAIICCCYFLPYILTNTPLTYGTDIKPQWFLFYEEFNRLITNFKETGTLPFYSWSLFLGNNFFASKSYYLMGDIYSYIGLLINLQFFNMAMILEIIKLFVSSITMYFFLKEIGIKNKTRIIGSICYAFSSWSIFFSGQLSFLSFYSWMPLYFLGMEFYLRRNKKILFILSTSLLLFTNFYFFYTISLLSPLYFGYRYYLINKNFRGFWKNAITLIIYYLIGVMISSVLTIPTLYYIMGNDRVGQMGYLVSFDQVKIYMHDLVSMFVPNYLYIYNNNIFETGWHVTRELCMWSGSIVAFLCVQIFGYKDKVFKKATLIVYFVLLFILLIPIMNSVMHGFSDPSFRWTLFFIFFNIIVACTFLDNIKLISKVHIKYSGLLLFFLLIAIIPITGLVDKISISLIISEYYPQMCLFTIFAFILLIYSLILHRSKINTNLLIILTVIEIIFSGATLYLKEINHNKNNRFEFINDVTHVLEYNDNELNNFLNNIEKVNETQYYRVYVTHEELYWSYSHNMNLMYGLNGLMTYDSTYTPSFNKMKQFAPQVRDFEADWIFNIKDGNLITFLNTKYALVLDEEQLPGNCNWRLITDDYRGFISVYRNDDYRELGRTYSKLMTYDDFKNKNNDTQLLLEYVISDEKIADYLGNSEAILENINYTGNQLTGDVFSVDDSFMVLTLPYDKSWKIMINGKEISYYDVNGGFIGIPITKGNNDIEMYFIPEGFKLGVSFSVIGIVLMIFILYIDVRKSLTSNKEKDKLLSKEKSKESID